jgi:hypothetical protein
LFWPPKGHLAPGQCLRQPQLPCNLAPAPPARTQSETGNALKDAAQHYKVDTDAITQKVRAELAAKEKAQAAKKTAAKAQPKPARPTAAKKAKAA